MCRPTQQYLFKTGVPRGVRAIDLELTEKSVVVTGGNRGIGLAIAQAFANEGANVAAVGGTRKRLSRHAPISRVAGSRRGQLPQISLPRMDALP